MYMYIHTYIVLYIKIKQLSVLHVVSAVLYYYMHAVFSPKQNSRHDSRACFGWRLWPHQSFCNLPIHTSKGILYWRLVGPTCFMYAGENTGMYNIHVLYKHNQYMNVISCDMQPLEYCRATLPQITTAMAAQKTLNSLWTINMISAALLTSYEATPSYYIQNH